MIKTISTYWISVLVASIFGGFAFVVSGGLGALNNNKSVFANLIVGFIFFTVALLISASHAKSAARWDEELKEMESKTYQDYIKRHPENFKNGKITCHSCGSSLLGSRSVKRGFFMTSHYCRQCGEDLYYSKEKH